MSVILFNASDEVYRDMATSYESLKHLLAYDGKTEERDQEFYMSLRRLHFANVASWLCTYHDDTPLATEELACIDPFDDDQIVRQRVPRDGDKYLCLLHKLIKAWNHLCYNLVTNGGEMYRPVKSFEFMQDLIARLTDEVVEHRVEGATQWIR